MEVQLCQLTVWAESLENNLPVSTGTVVVKEVARRNSVILSTFLGCCWLLQGLQAPFAEGESWKVKDSHFPFPWGLKTHLCEILCNSKPTSVFREAGLENSLYIFSVETFTFLSKKSNRVCKYVQIKMILVWRLFFSEEWAEGSVFQSTGCLCSTPWWFKLYSHYVCGPPAWPRLVSHPSCRSCCSQPSIPLLPALGDVRGWTWARDPIRSSKGWGRERGWSKG